MPTEIKKYTCSFKCRRKAKAKIKDVIDHELTCWNNPANKTCRTCSNEIYETDSDDFKSWRIRGCKIQAISEAIDEIYEKIKKQGSDHIYPIQQCPYHNVKPEPNIAQLFKEELISESKSMNTIHLPYKKPFEYIQAEESSGNDLPW